MREICRNFQRGSCRFGDECRYLHVQQQQRNSNVHGFGAQRTSQNPNSNPFGFGSASHQQHNSSNAFGFGTQNSSHSNRGPHSDSKPNQFKPFENKWNRQSSQSKKPDNQSQSANHQCTDPEICKSQIAEDFEQEKPLWVLTCYSHCKNAPCDIVGDISYEELRAAAYADAKQGMSFQSIVEKERNLLKSKLAEFQKLLSEPYKIPLNSSLVSQRHQSTGANANPFSIPSQNNGPLSVSSFSQLGASMNTGFERPLTPPVNTLVQPNSFGSGVVGNSLSPNFANLSSSGISGAQSMTMFPNSTSQQSSTAFNVSNPTTMFQATSQQSSIPFNVSSPTTMFQTTSDVQSLNKPPVENVSGDVSIWLKEKWIPGEIPEEAPPDAFVR